MVSSSWFFKKKIKDFESRDCFTKTAPNETESEISKTETEFSTRQDTRQIRLSSDKVLTDLKRPARECKDSLLKRNAIGVTSMKLPKVSSCEF